MSPGLRQALPGRAVRCSFCRKPREEVAKLVCGSESSICDECLRLIVDIMALPDVRHVVVMALPDVQHEVAT